MFTKCRLTFLAQKNTEGVGLFAMLSAVAGVLFMYSWKTYSS